MVNREEFVQHLLKVLEGDLENKLPVEGIKTVMLLEANKIITNTITHITNGIHKAMEEGK